MKRITGNQGEISARQCDSYKIKILKTTLEFNKNKKKYLKIISYCLLFLKNQLIYLAKTYTQRKQDLIFSSVSSLQLVENDIFLADMLNLHIMHLTAKRSKTYTQRK